MVAMLTRTPTSEEKDGEAEVVAVEAISTAFRRRHNTVGTFWHWLIFYAENNGKAAKAAKV